jgi:hypothetical protein
MAWRFVAKPGVVAIQNGHSDYLADNPHLDPKAFIFNSKLGYMTAIQTMIIPSLTFSAIGATYRTVSTGKKGKSSVTYPVPNSGYRMHFLGDVTGSGINDPILLFYEYAGEKYHMGNMPIYPTRQGSYIPRTGSHYRILSPVIAPYGSSYGIYILERYSLTGNPALPEQTITNVRVLRTNIARAIPGQGGNTKMLKISPTEFVAGYGQVNLLTRFLKRGIDPNSFFIGSGKTLMFDGQGNAAFHLPLQNGSGEFTTVRESGNVDNYKWSNVTFKSILL